MNLFSDLGLRECEAGLWAAGSFVVYLLPTHAAWAGRHRLGMVAEAKWLSLGAQAGRWAVWIGIPYLALGGWPMQSGAIPASAMGLIGSTWSWRMWVEALGQGTLIGLAIFLGLEFTRLVVGRAQRARGRQAPVRPGPARPWWEQSVEVAALDVHWAFYWATMAVVSGDRYAGQWLGLGLIYLELALHPFWRRNLGSPEGSQGCWEQAALALGVTMVFWQTGSLWICMGVHEILAVVLSQKSARRRRAALAVE